MELPSGVYQDEYGYYTLCLRCNDRKYTHSIDSAKLALGRRTKQCRRCFQYKELPTTWAIRCPEGWMRFCPSCGTKVVTKLRYHTQRAMDTCQICRDCSVIQAKNDPITGQNTYWYGRKHSEETKQKMSKAQKANRATWTAEQWETYSISRSKLPINNLKQVDKTYSRGWSGWYMGKHFRSLYELKFLIENPNAVSAETVNWTSVYEYNGKVRRTFPDFVLEDEKRIIEIKPLKLQSTEQVQAKSASTKRLAKDLGYTYELLDPGLLETKILEPLLDQDLVVFTESTKLKYNKWLDSRSSRKYVAR